MTCILKQIIIISSKNQILQNFLSNKLIIMGPKRKLEPIQKQVKPNPPSVVSQKSRTLKFADGSIIQSSDTLLSKYSIRFRKKIQQFKGDQVIELDEMIDKHSFKYIEQFLNIRKDKQIPTLHFPIKSNINLKYIMDQNDANLMKKINNEGGLPLIRKMLDISTHLEIEELRKRLFCLVALKLSTKTIDDLKETYEISSKIQTNEDQLKLEMKSHLEKLKKGLQRKIDEQ